MNMNTKQKILLLSLILTPTFIYASSKSSNSGTVIYGLIGLVIFSIYLYVLIIGFSANRGKPDSENGSVGCMICVSVGSILFFLYMIARGCS